MLSDSYEIVGEEFKVGYRRQEYWGWRIATAFFFGEVGAGLFLVSAFYNFMTGMLIGWGLVTVCKPTALFMHLGKPLRAWRAIMHLSSSWISRGLCGSIIFTGFGGAHMLNLKYHIVGGFAASLLFVLAMLGCLVVLFYLGFVLSYSAAIPLWDTGLMPIFSISYGLLGGVTLVLLFGHDHFLATGGHTYEVLKAMELGLILFCGVTLASFLHGAAYGPSAGRKAVVLLLKDRFAIWFIPFVVVIGIVLTALLSAFGPDTLVVLLLVAIAELIGDLGVKILLFKTGLYEPVMAHSRF